MIHHFCWRIFSFNLPSSRGPLEQHRSRAAWDISLIQTYLCSSLCSSAVTLLSAPFTRPLHATLPAMGLAGGAPVHAAGIAGVGGGAFKSPEHFLELLLLVLRALHESRPCLGQRHRRPKKHVSSARPPARN